MSTDQYVASQCEVSADKAITRADPDLVEALDVRFRETCTHEAVESAEHEWPAVLWDSLAADGFTTVGVAEEFGGSSGSIVDACAVLRAAGRYAAPVPLAETGLLAGWAAAALGGELPGGLTVVADGAGLDRAGGTTPKLSGRIARVPWARKASHIALALDGDVPAVAVVAVHDIAVEESANLAGEPRDAVVLRDVLPVDYAELDGPTELARFFLLGALSRAALASGAIERLTDLSLEYTSQRRQFGRPVGRFQAVQQHLVTLAEAAAMSLIAAEVAAAAAEAGDGRHEIAFAKAESARLAGTATRAAHQAHGAMGMTREYPLHHFSRRLWSWSTEFGDERYWTSRIGSVAVGLGADGLYPFIADPAGPA